MNERLLVCEDIANLGLEIDKRIWLDWDKDPKLNDIACKAHQSFANSVISKNINVAIEELNLPEVRLSLFEEGMVKADVVFDRFLSKYCKDYRQNNGRGMEETKTQLLKRVKERFRRTLKPHFDAAINHLCISLEDIGKVASQYVSEQTGGRPIESIEFELPRPIRERVPTPAPEQVEPEPEALEEVEAIEEDITSIPSTSRQSRLPPLPIYNDFMNFHNDAVFNYFHDPKFAAKVDRNYRKEWRERRKNNRDD